MGRIPPMVDGGGGKSSGKWFRISSLKNRETAAVRGRFTGEFVSGFEGWDTDNKPHRAPTMAELLQKMKEAGAELRVEDDQRNPKQFWASEFVNVSDDMVQAISFTQVSIFKALDALDNDPEWGDLNGYDVTIKYLKDKSGKVSYSVSPCKPTKLSAKLDGELTALRDKWVGLEALYHNGDPFADYASVK